MRHFQNYFIDVVENTQIITDNMITSLTILISKIKMSRWYLIFI